jgi:thiosulfate/3-mercaptopyruvate sulfurtransferase
MMKIGDCVATIHQLHEIPVGPVLFLRNWGVSRDELLPTHQVDYKLPRIRQVLDTHADLPFILIGDSGEEDPGRPRAIEVNFRRVGLEPDRPVVVYTGKGLFKGWGDGLEQTMMAYTLARFGHHNVYVLDGGLEAWMADQGAISQVFPSVQASRFGVTVREDYFVPYDTFRTIKDRPNTILLDARPADVYQGQGPWMKPGHIPGAINVPWKSFMDDDNPRLLKSDDEIQEILDEHEITPEKTVICSCGIGREATNEFLLFQWYLGYPKVKIYEGSFTEWTAHAENPTVTGPEPV